MKVGIQLPEVEYVARRDEVAAMARAAEEVGFDSLWVGDHLLYREPDRGPWDAWTTLAWLAGITERIELGPLVACTAFHPPGVLARMAAATHELSARPARARPRLRLERGRVPCLRPSVRPSRLPVRGGVHDRPAAARRRARDVRGALPPGRRRRAPAEAHDGAEADARCERAADALDRSAARRELEHLVLALRQHGRRLRRGERWDLRDRRACGP